MLFNVWMQTYKSTYRHLAAEKIKQIKNNNYDNIMHKRHHYILKQIKCILDKHNLSIVKADKGKSIAIIHNDSLHAKVLNFIQLNHMIPLNKDPTDKFQKQIQQAVNSSKAIVHKSQHKFTIQMNPKAPRPNALIKTHKVDKPIRPVINGIGTPSYKLARFLNRQLNQLIQLPYTFALRNSLEIAQELANIEIDTCHQMTTFDVKDLYVNLPVHDLIQATQF
jgi:hypothetical protein